MTDRLRLAVPNKGRLVEPTLALLHDAGLVFESTDRSLVARVRNFDLDILFVRTDDVIEFVRDAVADLGVTGIDLLCESGADLPQVRLLGYGQCRLAAAVPAARGPHPTPPRRRSGAGAGDRVRSGRRSVPTAASIPNPPGTARTKVRHKILCEIDPR